MTSASHDHASDLIKNDSDIQPFISDMRTTMGVMKSIVVQLKHPGLHVESDLEQGIAGVAPIPPDDAGKDEVIYAIVANVDAMTKADRKITALKELQGHIWQTGYANNELEGIVYDDVPEALEKCNSYIQWLNFKCKQMRVTDG